VFTVPGQFGWNSRPPGKRAQEGVLGNDREQGRVWHQDQSGRVHTPLEPIVLAATLLLIPVFILEIDGTGWWKSAAFVANWFVWGVFAAEYVAILMVAGRKGAAVRAHWLDAIVVVTTIPLFSKWLASLRFARFARLLRFMRAAAIVSRAIQAERRLSSPQLFRAAAIFTVFAVFIAGAAAATLDSGDFKSYWNGIWWAIVTVTTVGYGDVYPTTVAGRLIAISLMMLGIGFLSVLTATIASRFIQTDTGSDEIRESLARIERELADVKKQLAEARHGS
jgi:voltage-gated potassium channel